MLAAAARRAKSVFELGGPRVYTYRELASWCCARSTGRSRSSACRRALMKVAGLLAQQIAIVGLMPPITADQVELMVPRQHRAAGRQSLATLGIQPTAAEAILPTYLDRFRVGGRYNQHAPA